MPFIDTRDRSKKVNQDYTNAVDVVMSHTTDGRFIPLYFRVVGADSIRETFKIDAIKYVKDKHGCTTFCCLLTNHDRKKEIYLTYYFDSHVWVID